MADLVNPRTLEIGALVELEDGSTMEVVENPRDGTWLICRPVDAPDAKKQVVFVSEIAGVGEIE